MTTAITFSRQNDAGLRACTVASTNQKHTNHIWLVTRHSAEFLSSFFSDVISQGPTFGSGNLDVSFVSAGQKVVAITRRSYGGVSLC